MSKVNLERLFFYTLVVLVSIISLALVAASPAFFHGTHVVYQGF